MKAIAKIKANGVKAKFAWYGDVQTGEEEYGDQVFAMQHDLGIEDVFTFYPATTEIVKHYQQCDIFCLPSIYEGFPNVVCEAMSCGKPIACSRVCDNPYIVQENVNGVFFDPNNVDDIAATLTRLINMPADSRMQMGVKSREIGETLFSKSAFVNKYINLIDRL
jgi:glycosyltransferase involved in cell wall biosynthesis